VHPLRAELVMAGGGAVAEARSRVAEHGMADDVRVTDWVPPSQAEELLRSSHVLVLPSTHEGQPMAILEAMAHGLCVVATAVGGIPDLIDEECGVLIPPSDEEALITALGSVLTDADRRSRLGAAALTRVRDRFDVDLTWRQIAALYEDISG
jgi:glycosyltransferase involved in cell wall biosynthesis